jgi:phosphatidylserine decarboxylase
MSGMLRKILLNVAILLLSAFGCAVAQQSSPNATEKPVHYQVGQWQPSDQKGLHQRVEGLVRETNAEAQPLLPVVQELKNLIESDPELLMLFTQMFEQVPSNTPEYQKDPTGQPQIRDYRLMLHCINRVMTKAPEFNQTCLVGFPINAIINWPMATPAGTTVFLNPKVNNQLKKILNQWGEFLKSKESRYVLNDNPETGWFGRDAKKAMPTFIEDFQCDPKQPYYGFTSWDNFFTRQFREGRRPVASPMDNTVIANSCESAPYRLAKGVKGSDTFWIKSQPYSLYHMLAGDPLIGQFEGGTIYQAFLSALSYHRWHSPVSGRIVKTQLIDGSYYAAALSVGFDPAGPNESQGYITQVASRALIFIEADNPDIGLMAVLFVGMAEVSSNEITVSVGQHVSKGDQLGMFHFGGSTHCLIFRPQVKLKFDLRGQTPGLDSTNIPVRSKIATVMNQTKW